MSEHFLYTAFYSACDFLHQLVRSFSVAADDIAKALTHADSSSVPNFILAFIPAQINADTLNTMTALYVFNSLSGLMT